MRLRTSKQVEHRRHLEPTGRSASSLIERTGKRLIDLGSNNYLGLANDSRVRQAAIEAIKSSGTSASASPVLSGYGMIHQELSELLCEYKSCDSALLFPSGFSANLATVSASVEQDSILLCDRRCHASLIDGCRLSGTETRFFRHCDLQHLKSLLVKYHGRNTVVVMEGLYSMDGTWAPVDELRKLARQHDFLLIFDEAHSNGVTGPQGAGLLQQNHLEKNPILHVGTFSKAFASQGGFVVGPADQVDRVMQLGRPFMFSTSLSPPNAAAAKAALEISRSETSHRERLQSQVTIFREAISAQRWKVAAEPGAPIASILVGSAENAQHLSKLLFEEGVYAPAIRPPTVKPGSSRVRFSLSASATDSELSHALTALDRIRAQWQD